MERCVFLDRDNTLIANDGDLGDPDDVRLLDGVAVGLKALRQAGFRLVVVTNQAGVARGVFNEDDVDRVHQRIAHLIDRETGIADVINRFYYCPYHPDASLEEYRGDHPWRKPNPGMLLQAARDLRLDLSDCWMVGDQARDVEAGRSAGCRTVLVTADPSGANGAAPTAVTGSFGEAVQTILRESPRRTATRPRSGNRAPSPRRSDGEAPDHLTSLKQAINDLAQEIRSEQARRAEFTAARLAAGMCQLLVLLLAVLGLLQLGSSDLFFKWMIGAALAQLLTIAILLVDLKG